VPILSIIDQLRTRWPPYGPRKLLVEKERFLMMSEKGSNRDSCGSVTLSLQASNDFPEGKILLLLWTHSAWRHRNQIWGGVWPRMVR